MTRLAWYRQCGMSVFNYQLSPEVLALSKEEEKKEPTRLGRPLTLYQPFAYSCLIYFPYLLIQTLRVWVCTVVFVLQRRADSVL